MTSTGNEDEVTEKFENAAIIGSSIWFLLITILMIIMVRKYISNKSTTSFTAQANYNKMFCQEENVPEINENTHNTTFLE